MSSLPPRVDKLAGPQNGPSDRCDAASEEEEEAAARQRGGGQLARSVLYSIRRVLAGWLAGLRSLPSLPRS